MTTLRTFCAARVAALSPAARARGDVLGHGVHLGGAADLRRGGAARPAGPAAAALTRLLVAGVVALLLPVLSAGPASACSCAQISTADSVAGSDAVFLAVAGPGDEVTVREVFTGMVPSRLEVQEAASAPCASGLVDAQRYVVFAMWDRERQEYSTSPCSGTARATAALVAEVVTVTGPGRPPYDVPGGLPDDSGEHGLGALGPWAWALVAGSAAVLLLLGCVGVLVVRANRTNR